MTTESILGPMAKRTKIDLRLPVAIAERMKVLADSIGIPANAVYAMAAAPISRAAFWPGFMRCSAPSSTGRSTRSFSSPTDNPTSALPAPASCPGSPSEPPSTGSA